MQPQNCELLKTLIAQHSNIPSFKTFQHRLQTLTTSPQADIANLLQVYKDVIPLLESEIWHSQITQTDIDTYQKLFREMEALITSQGNDNRFQFVIIIPVADRPQHLHACLNSLLELCKLFNYGGSQDGSYRKVSVIISDDSKHPDNISKHKSLAQSFTDNGLTTNHFSLEEQIAQLDTLNHEEQIRLSAILGEINKDDFSHKGASIMRNITYLKLSEIARQDSKTLFFFVDSDQEFRVKVQTENGDKDIYSTNYFYYLNEIFSNTGASILTGKVVGDPPVSPSVMTSRFLDDVISFLQQISQKQPHNNCEFHNRIQDDQEGAYHDMAELFGFNKKIETYDYNCPVTGQHDHNQCLNRFAKLLNHFFYGEHPTRTSYYHHENILENLKPARTVYTGNYIFKADALKYFIPFATLKLRMAGPVLGRLIKSEISGRFISANLPMLHKRTVEDTGQSEFRPGIEQQSQVIDLSGEFKRQFFGDVMLFTIEKLTEEGFPAKDMSQKKIHDCLMVVENEMLQKYLSKHDEIAHKLELLKSINRNPIHWWNTLPEMESARVNIKLFINNIEHNFDHNSKGYKLLCSHEDRQQQLSLIAEAIARYKTDRTFWELIIKSKQQNH